MRTLLLLFEFTFRSADIRALSPLVHRPKLTQYDQWGRRIDRLDTSEGWRKLKDVAIREGLVSIAHERRYGEHSRIYGFAKIMIWSGDSHMVWTLFLPFMHVNGLNDMSFR
jgi:hypothetical protein